MGVGTVHAGRLALTTAARSWQVGYMAHAWRNDEDEEGEGQDEEDMWAAVTGLGLMRLFSAAVEAAQQGMKLGGRGGPGRKCSCQVGVPKSTGRTM